MIDNYITFQISYFIIVLMGINLLIFINYGVKAQKYRLTFTLLIVTLISLFIGIRTYNIGIDTGMYYQIYNHSLVKDDLEPLFYFLVNFIGFFNMDYQVFFIVLSLMINLLISIAFINITKQYPLAISIFLSTFLFINMNINILRQGLAIAIVFFALSQLKSKYGKIKFLLLAVIAVFIHYTSILFSLIFFLRNVTLNTKKIIYLIIFYLIAYNIYISDILVLIKNYNPYLERIYWYFGWARLTAWHLKHIYILSLLMILVYFYLIHKKIQLKKEIYFYLVVLLYGWFLVLTFKEETMVADRIFYYFIPVSIILIIHLITYFKNIHLIIIIFFINIWFIKSALIQFHKWFMLT